MSHTSVLPACGAADHLPGFDRAAVGLQRAVLRLPAVLEPRHLRVRDGSPTPARVGPSREPPHHGVAAHDPAGRVVEGAHDRDTSPSSETLHRRAQARFTSAVSTSWESIPCNRLTSARLAITNIARSECASVKWPHWENSRLKFSSRRQLLVHVGRWRHRSARPPASCSSSAGSSCCGRRRPSRCSPFEHGDVADAEPEVVRGGEAVRATADDHVVGVLELAGRAPQPAGLKISRQVVQQGVVRTGPPPGAGRRRRPLPTGSPRAPNRPSSAALVVLLAQ